MVQQGNHSGRNSIIAGYPGASRAVLLIHGYSGSPTDFADLPDEIAHEFQAFVHVPLLPGHGTRVEDLLKISFADMLNCARDAYKALQKPGVSVCLGGHSFGGQLAALLAAEHNPTSFFTSVTPYQLRPPLNFKITSYISRMKTVWRKKLPQEEYEERKRAFFYAEMPGAGLGYVQEANRRLEAQLHRITAPSLMIHAQNDRLSYPESGGEMLSKMNSSVPVVRIIENGRHSVYFGNSYREVADEIKSFLRNTI